MTEKTRDKERALSVPEGVNPSWVTSFFPMAPPWAATFSQFVEEHKAEPAVRGETFEGVGFVYYPRSNRGIWYEKIGEAYAMGLLDKSALSILSEVATEAGHF